MLNIVVDQCLSLALASATRQGGFARYRAVSPRGRASSPLAHYPRLQAVLEKAEADGVIARRRLGRGLR